MGWPAWPAIGKSVRLEAVVDGIWGAGLMTVERSADKKETEPRVARLAGVRMGCVGLFSVE